MKSNLVEIRTKFSKGLIISFQKLLEAKKLEKSNLVISRNGKVIEISAEEYIKQRKSRKNS